MYQKPYDDINLPEGRVSVEEFNEAQKNQSSGGAGMARVAALMFLTCIGLATLVVGAIGWAIDGALLGVGLGIVTALILLWKVFR